MNPNFVKKTTTIPGDGFVVLWSPDQNQFHVETINEMLESNIRIYLQQKRVGYIVLSFADSAEEAHQIIEMFEESRAKVAPMVK